MKLVFIGHRGVGKTSLLKRHQNYFPGTHHFDLDTEIESAEQRPVSEIFKFHGEKKFREIEFDIFKKLIQQKNFVISTGAGFNCANIPNDVEIIYVSRRTDSDGRIFLNRPALNPELSSFDEYALRFKAREPAFRRAADFVYHLSEGLVQKNENEKKIFEKFIILQNAFVTMIPHHFQYLKKFSNIELRTDFFSDNEIQQIMLENDNKFLVSYRKKTSEINFKSGSIDWALELGAVPVELKKAELIVSNHDDELKMAIQKFESYPDNHQKLCPVISTWSELMIGHEWQSAKPDQRSFLPRTVATQEKSLWRWYRQLQFLKQKINFIQGHQNFDDQPSLFEYLNIKNNNTFAAVLGYPVHHSKTPMTQGQNIDLNVLPIPVAAIDFKIAIPILQKMGLIAAAVTSPLKTAAGLLCHQQNSLNTIVFKNNQWFGTSTDQYGLIKLISEVPNIENKKIAIWGGGGVLDSISKIIPHAVFYSAQTGKPRDQQIPASQPEILIWAAPRKLNIHMPPANWNPEYVVDLNYTENSLGLEYAQKIITKYISGDKMFYAQAEKQLLFWKEKLKD